jgi:2-polyprenyl-3-methyl-5-hydroxy-6-metoxy-1,4-benzoquinol methylase
LASSAKEKGNPMLKRIDSSLTEVFGLSYLNLTRDQAIYDRCEYFLHVIRELMTKPIRILDVGCGSGAIFYFMSRRAPEWVSNYVGIDLHASRLRERYKNITTAHAFYDIDLDDDWNVGTFDVAWCSECIEHILDDKGVFQKICRSVAPGGLIVVTMPSSSNRRRVGAQLPELLLVAPRQDGGHVRVGYEPSSLVALCEGTSAELIRCDGVTKADVPYMHRRYRWPGPMQFANNVLNIVSRTAGDRYTIGVKAPIDYSEYQSISGIYRIK